MKANGCVQEAHLFATIGDDADRETSACRRVHAESTHGDLPDMTITYALRLLI